MNAKTIALYLSLGLTSSLIIGAGVSAEQLSGMTTIIVDTTVTDTTAVDTEWHPQEDAANNALESGMSLLAGDRPFPSRLKSLREYGERLVKGEFPNVHDLDEEDLDEGDDDCWDDDDLEDEHEWDDDDDYEDDEDDDYEDDDDDDDDEDDDDDYCEEEELEKKGSETKKKVLLVSHF